MNRRVKLYFNYIYQYPEGCLSSDGVDLSNQVFYVGKGTGTSRMDAHLTEALNGCECEKCSVIRWIWSLEKVPGRQIVFQTVDHQESLDNEKHLIQVVYKDEPLVNVQHTPKTPKKRSVTIVDEVAYEPASKQKETDVTLRTIHVLELDGEAYYCTTVACVFTGINEKGTRFIHLAEEYGINKFTRDYTWYYPRSELLAFIDWVNEKYPGVSKWPCLDRPEKFILDALQGDFGGDG